MAPENGYEVECKIPHFRVEEFEEVLHYYNRNLVTRVEDATEVVYSFAGLTEKDYDNLVQHEMENRKSEDYYRD